MLTRDQHLRLQVSGFRFVWEDGRVLECFLPRGGSVSRCASAAVGAWLLAAERATVAGQGCRGARVGALSFDGQPSRSLAGFDARRGATARARDPCVVARAAGGVPARAAVAVLGNSRSWHELEHESTRRAWR